VKNIKTMTSRIGVGVIGCGTIADSAHLPSYCKLPDAKLVAIADRNGERVKKVAEKYEVEASYEDYHDLLERRDIQAVSICTPPDTHAEIAIQAAQSKKHILCEKPMALQLSDADAMIQAAEENGVILMPSFPFRFDPSFQQLYKLVRKGIIGKPFMANAVFGNMGPRSYSDFYRNPKKGGGVILDIGVHHVDLLRWVMGEISDASSITWKSKSDLTVEDNAILSLTFENGTLGTLLLSWTYPSVACRVELIGEKGILLAGFSTDLGLYLAQGKISREQGALTILVKGKKFYFEMIKHFITCLKKGAKPIVDGLDGKKALEVILKSLSKS
jgi:predicted dehydrogenase